MTERDLSAADVRDEHLAAVDDRLQWVYLVTVIGGASVLMLVLLVVLEATSAA